MKKNKRGDPSTMNDGVILKSDIVRDFVITIINGGNQTIDTMLQFNALGLDFYIRNRGVAALTVSIAGQGAVTVDGGDAYTLNSLQFTRIDIVSAVNYDLQIFGLKYSTLQRLKVV